MHDSVFFETQFLVLVVFSLIVPAFIYWRLLMVRAVSQLKVLIFAFMLILIGGLDFALLQYLTKEVMHTSSLIDDFIFGSEITVALYLLPALFAGVGVNMISHLLIRHLTAAEDQYEREHPKR